MANLSAKSEQINSGTTHVEMSFSHRRLGLEARLADKCDNGRCQERPIDLVHLSSQTLGDPELQREVLMLFRRQSELLMLRLKSAANASDLKSVAHTIIGSAMGIGAWQVAKAARDVENCSKAGDEVDALQNSLKEAHVYIEALTA